VKRGLGLLADVGKPVGEYFMEQGAKTPWRIAPDRDLTAQPLTTDEINNARAWAKANGATRLLAGLDRVANRFVGGAADFATQSGDRLVNPEKYQGEGPEASGPGFALSSLGSLLQSVQDVPAQVGYLSQEAFGSEFNPVTQLMRPVTGALNVPELLQGQSLSDIERGAVNRLYEAPESPLIAAGVAGGIGRGLGKLRPRTGFEAQDLSRSEFIDRTLAEDRAPARQSAYAYEQGPTPFEQAEQQAGSAELAADRGPTRGPINQRMADAEAEANQRAMNRQLSETRKAKQPPGPTVPETPDPQLEAITSASRVQLMNEAVNLGVPIADVVKAPVVELQYLVSGGRLGVARESSPIPEVPSVKPEVPKPIEPPSPPAKLPVNEPVTADVSREAKTVPIAEKPPSVQEIPTKGPETAPLKAPAASVKGKEPWEMTRAEYYKSKKTLYHGGPEIPENVLKLGSKNGSDAGGLFFTDNPDYAKQYGANVYEVEQSSVGKNIFDPRKPRDVAKLKDGFVELYKQGEYDNLADALRDYEEVKKQDLLDWATGSQYGDAIESAGFEGAIFKERPGTVGIDESGQGFTVSGKPIYSVVSYKNDIKVSRGLHRDAVEQALSSGRPVPASVLADYPDLAAKPPASLPKAGEGAKVDTPTEAIAEIIEGKRESKIGTKEFKARMLAELDKAIETAPELSTDARRKMPSSTGASQMEYRRVWQNEFGVGNITVEIPGDGSFVVENTKEAISEVRQKVFALTEQLRPNRSEQVRRGEFTDRLAPYVDAEGDYTAVYQTRKGHFKPRNAGMEVKDRTLKEGLADGTVEFTPASAAPAKETITPEGRASAFAPKESIPLSKSMEPGGESISIKQIRDKLSSELKIPIRTGRFRVKVPGGTRYGIYKGGAGVARLADWGDIPALTHEIAHGIDQKFGGRRLHVNDAEIRGLDYDQTKKRSSEGFAEYVRMWMTGEDAAGRAPKFSKKFDAFLDENPGLKKTLTETRRMITKYREQGAYARVLSQIGHKPGRFFGSFTKQNIGDALARIRDLWTDPRATIKRFEAEGRGTKNINARTVPPLESPYQIHWDATATATGKAKAFVEDGVTDFGGKKVYKSLKEALSPVADKMDDWMAYAYSRRALDLWKRDINPGIDLADAKHVVKTLETPELRAVTEDIHQWQGKVLDYMVDAGGLTPEVRAAIETMNPVYVPLKRVMDGLESISGPGKRVAGLSSGVKRIKGSGRPVENIVESMIRQTATMIGTADRIRLGRTIAEFAEKREGLGRWIEKVEAPKQATTTSLERIQGALKEAGVDLSDADLSQVINVYQNAQKITGRDNVVSFVRNGKQEFYQLHPNLYKSLMATDQPVQHIALRILAIPTRLKRMAVTGLNPEFALGVNPFRDAFTFGLQSEYAKGLPHEIVRGLAQEFGKGEMRRLFRASGADMSTMMGLDRQSLKRTVAESLANDAKAKAMGIVKHPIDAAREIMSVFESGPRLAEFGAAYKELSAKYGEGANARIGASIASRDVTTDFTRMGVYSRVLNSIIPFFNVAIQGPSKMARTMKAHPIRSGLLGITTITAPTIALWSINKDEQWYKELPAWRKYGFWNFEIGKYEDGRPKIMSLPRPFEWGLAFASAPEAYLNWRHNQDPNELTGMVDNAMKQLTPGYMPTVLQVPTELMMNKNMFQGRDIVPFYMGQNKAPQDQYFESTPQTYRELGKTLGWSPLMIQHGIEGFTGSIVTRGIKSAERGMGLTAPDQKMKQLSDLPVAGRFFPYQRSATERAESLKYQQQTELQRLRGIYRAGDKTDALKQLGYWNKRYPDFQITTAQVSKPKGPDKPATHPTRTVRQTP
jgi:hypothetical protein